MIGSIIWYNVGGGYKTIGIVVDHRKKVSLGSSVWNVFPDEIEDAVKIHWIKEEGPKPKSLNYYSPVADYEEDLIITKQNFLDSQKWYDLKYFKIISEVK